MTPHEERRAAIHRGVMREEAAHSVLAAALMRLHGAGYDLAEIEGALAQAVERAGILPVAAVRIEDAR